MSYTPKQRMLNAYRGVFSDRYPVAPEFWYYYPAKVLGVDMIEFERNIPLWKALRTTFLKYGTEGWAIVGPSARNPRASSKADWQKLSATQYRLTAETNLAGKTYQTVQVFDKEEPSWLVEWPVKDEADALEFCRQQLASDTEFGFAAAVDAHRAVGDDYLLELAIGGPFFDSLAAAMGFEKALFYAMSEEPALLEGLQARYIEFNRELVRRACRETPFESFFIGCCYACNSLTGPDMWRRLDKPYIAAMADEIHRHGRLLHIHFHGRCMETVSDFAEIGIDCVCPFERPPGGDVEGLAGLREVRWCLGGKVTFNGNVHTVATLIRGTSDDVRAEVRQIKETFAGEPRLIIGTGDQVGRETLEENIFAMIEEAKANR
ncbi:MAG: hypothetical protein GXY33_01920 [Phycisphaerae bacterium]|nr:hypothetical protein [Phycisphaerae bacterium]